VFFVPAINDAILNLKAVSRKGAKIASSSRLGGSALRLCVELRFISDLQTCVA